MTKEEAAIEILEKVTKYLGYCLDPTYRWSLNAKNTEADIVAILEKIDYDEEEDD